MADTNPTWWQYTGTGEPHKLNLPPAPPWRTFVQMDHGMVLEHYEPETDVEKFWTNDQIHRARTFEATRRMIELVNAALYLRRPLLITGKPGTGKSSLAYAVAYELQLGHVLTWPVTSRSTLQDALYRYDALGRLQDTNLEQSQQEQGNVSSEIPSSGPKPSNIGDYIRLGPLGTALLPTRQPQVLLIDEIDKSSIDLPNDLLHIFETGRYEIPELSRLTNEVDKCIEVKPQYGEKKVRIYNGEVVCAEFPFVILTSNGERDLPPPFLRRCIRLDIKEPTAGQLAKIIERKFPGSQKELLAEVLDLFEKKRQEGSIMATDQLLNAIYLRLQHVDLLADLDESAGDTEDEQGLIKEKLKDAILRRLNEQG